MIAFFIFIAVIGLFLLSGVLMHMIIHPQRTRRAQYEVEGQQRTPTATLHDVIFAREVLEEDSLILTV